MTTYVKTSAWAALVTAMGLALSPMACAADPPAQAMLYELTENMRLKDKKIVHRMASSVLAGSSVVGTAFCPSDLVQASNANATSCALSALGSDDVNMNTGLGTFTAKVSIVVQGDNPFDGPEVVVDKIKVKGKMDFSPALLGGMFFGTVKGFADVETTPGKDKFTGVFRLPFIGSATYPYVTGGYTFRQVLCPGTPNHNPNFPLNSDFAYVETANGLLTGNCIDIHPDELSLGWPSVRFDIWFQ